MKIFKFFFGLGAQSPSFALKYSTIATKLIYVIAVYRGICVIEIECVAFSVHF